jgi:ADP-heptose:LPS heptosyltransferase
MGPSRILVTRTDKLGDFMLTWPALDLLRRALPAAHITVLVGEGAAPMARACPVVDEVLVDRGQPVSELADVVRQGRFDAAIVLFSTWRIALAVRRAGVPYRLAPATKLAQVLFNNRLVQRRSQSIKPEHAYNVDLILRFLDDHGLSVPDAPVGPYLSFSPSVLAETSSRLGHAYGIPEQALRVIVHPGSGGSASTLPADGFARLVSRLTSTRPVFVMVTAGPGEESQARAVRDRIRGHSAAVHVSSDGLIEFARVLATADLFLSGSTGPLHIAGAIDVPTAAFYPRRRSSTALRWQTTNQPRHRLAFSPPDTAGESEMTAIDLDAAASAISQCFLEGRRD